MRAFLARHRVLIGLLLTAGVVSLPPLLFGQEDGGRLTGGQILDRLENPLIVLLPPALYSLAARTTDWVAGWSDGARRAVIWGTQVLVAVALFVVRGTLDEENVMTVLTSGTGILTGLTVPAAQAGVAKMATTGMP